MKQYVIPLLFLACTVQASQTTVYEALLIWQADLIAIINVSEVSRQFASTDELHMAKASVIDALKGCSPGDTLILHSRTNPNRSTNDLPGISSGIQLAFLKQVGTHYVPTSWMSLRSADQENIFWPRAPVSGQFVEQPTKSVIERIRKQVMHPEENPFAH